MPRLIVPGVRDDEPKFVCRVPVNEDGEQCGRLFYDDENRAYEKHTAKCWRANRGNIEALSRARNLDGLLDPWDPDLAAHMEKVGETMIREGRLEVKPSERAGF